MFNSFGRVAVTGGRSYPDRDKVFAVLDNLKPEVVIHGACTINGELSGADRWADEWAVEHGVPILRYPAEWERYGNSAGPIRNRKMLKESHPDVLVKFPGGRGTIGCARIADGLGIYVINIG